MVRYNIPSTLALSLLSASSSQAQTAVESDRWDVVVLGGGSSGTFSAIRLQQQGLNVALIERQNRLGGKLTQFHCMHHKC